MPPGAVAFTRVALGMVVLLVVVRLKGLRLPTGRKAWRHFAVVGPVRQRPALHPAGVG